MPAPAARMRSARLPCGTSSSSTLPLRYRPSKICESTWRGNEQMILRTRPAPSSAASPVLPLPALVLMVVRAFVPFFRRGADALGQVALRHQFQFDLAAAVQAVEDLRIDLARERADDLAHAARAQQRGQAGGAVAGVVVDDGEVFRALFEQGVDQFHRLAGRAETADQDGGAVGYVRQGGCRVCNEL